MNIRAAVVADIPAIIALERSAPTSAHYSELQYQEIVAQGMALPDNTDPGSALNPSQPSVPEEPGSLQELSRVVLVVEEDSRVRGFFIGRVLGSEWEIENLVVAEDVRRGGSGGRLVDKLVELALSREADKIFLEVRESNAAARTLYEKCGFAETGCRRNYYHDPEEDAVLYAKNLPGCK